MICVFFIYWTANFSPISTPINRCAMNYMFAHTKKYVVFCGRCCCREQNLPARMPKCERRYNCIDFSLSDGSWFFPGFVFSNFPLQQLSFLPSVMFIVVYIIRNGCGRMLARRVYGRTIVAPIIIIRTPTQHAPPRPSSEHTNWHSIFHILFLQHIERWSSADAKVNDDYYCREMCNYQLPEMASACWLRRAGRMCDFWFCTIYLALTVDVIAPSSPFAA